VIRICNAALFHRCRKEPNVIKIDFRPIVRIHSQKPKERLQDTQGSNVGRRRQPPAGAFADGVQQVLFELDCLNIVEGFEGFESRRFLEQKDDICRLARGILTAPIALDQGAQVFVLGTLVVLIHLIFFAPHFFS
jgi:hypothetical protein